MSFADCAQPHGTQLHIACAARARLQPRGQQPMSTAASSTSSTARIACSTSGSSARAAPSASITSIGRGHEHEVALAEMLRRKVSASNVPTRREISATNGQSSAVGTPPGRNTKFGPFAGSCARYDATMRSAPSSAGRAPGASRASSGGARGCVRRQRARQN